MHGSRGRRRRLAKARRAGRVGDITGYTVVMFKSGAFELPNKNGRLVYVSPSGRTPTAPVLQNIPAPTPVEMMTNRELSRRLKALQGAK